MAVIVYVLPIVVTCLLKSGETAPFPTVMIWSPVGGEGRRCTLSWKVVLEAAIPSWTVMVMTAVPACPSDGMRVTVRLVPWPPSAIWESGTSVGFAELA